MTGDWWDDPLVCMKHMRFLPCRQESQDDPCEHTWSNTLPDVLAVEQYQKGEDDDEQRIH